MPPNNLINNLKDTNQQSEDVLNLSIRSLSDDNSDGSLQMNPVQERDLCLKWSTKNMIIDALTSLNALIHGQILDRDRLIDNTTRLLVDLSNLAIDTDTSEVNDEPANEINAVNQSDERTNLIVKLNFNFRDTLVKALMNNKMYISGSDSFPETVKSDLIDTNNLVIVKLTQMPVRLEKCSEIENNESNNGNNASSQEINASQINKTMMDSEINKIRDEIERLMANCEEELESTRNENKELKKTLMKLSNDFQTSQKSTNEQMKKLENRCVLLKKLQTKLNADGSECCFTAFYSLDLLRESTSQSSALFNYKGMKWRVEIQKFAGTRDDSTMVDYLACYLHCEVAMDRTDWAVNTNFEFKLLSQTSNYAYVKSRSYAFDTRSKSGGIRKFIEIDEITNPASVYVENGVFQIEIELKADPVLAVID